MAQRLFVFILLATILCAAEKKPRVAVLAFTAKGVSQMESEAVTELFSSALVSSRAFDVLDRANMENILREQQFQQTGCTEAACAVKIGKVLNVEYMIYGVVMVIGGKYFVSANMVNIETSKIEKSGQESAESMKEIHSALRRLIEKITGVAIEEADRGTKIKYFGRVTSVNGSEVTINAGADDGVNFGDECTVLSGKKTKRRNNQNGMMENVNVRTEIGKIRLTTVEANESTGIIISGTIPTGSMVDLNTLPYNNPNPWIVGGVSLLSPAVGQFLVKDNIWGQICGTALQAFELLVVIDMLIANNNKITAVAGYTYTTPTAYYTNYKCNAVSTITGITWFTSDPWRAGEAPNLLFFAPGTPNIIFAVGAGLIVANCVWSVLAATYNAGKYDELSKFAYANEPSVSFAIAPTPEFDGMSMRFAMRWQ